MALSLSCPCGATFEVEDTFAGQTVSCPECQGSVKAPAPHRGPPRTSGLAVASLVLALLGAFTVIGTLAAILCGLGALASIGRSGGRLSGAGLAVFGTILGVLFTGLTLFAYSRGELFGVGDQFRQQLLGGQADFSGPLEIVRNDQGYKITRPSEKWGRARHDLAEELGEKGNLLLVNPSRDAYVAVHTRSASGQSAERLRQEIVKSFEDDAHKAGTGNLNDQLHRVTDVKVRQTSTPKSDQGYEIAEVVLDARVANQPFTYLIRVVKKPRGARAYVIHSWTFRRRFAREEADLRKVVESLRILD
jgi:hypothetical protein